MSVINVRIPKGGKWTVNISEEKEEADDGNNAELLEKIKVLEEENKKLKENLEKMKKMNEQLAKANAIVKPVVQKKMFVTKKQEKPVVSVDEVKKITTKDTKALATVKVNANSNKPKSKAELVADFFGTGIVVTS